jgi:hypothetical protein
MKTMALTGFWWLTPIIPVVRRQPGQIVHETLSQKNPLEKRAGGVAQSVGPEFKPQYHKKKKKEREREKRWLCLFCSFAQCCILSTWTSAWLLVISSGERIQ